MKPTHGDSCYCYPSAYWGYCCACPPSCGAYPPSCGAPYYWLDDPPEPLPIKALAAPFTAIWPTAEPAPRAIPVATMPPKPLPIPPPIPVDGACLYGVGDAGLGGGLGAAAAGLDGPLEKKPPPPPPDLDPPPREPPLGIFVIDY